MRAVRSVLAAAVTLATVLTPARAQAEDDAREDARAEGDASRERARLALCIGTYAAHARSTRPWLAGAAMGVGAASLGAGGALLLREPSLPGAVLTAHGALALGGGLYTLARDDEPFAQLDLTLREARATGLSDAETVRHVAAAWEQAAHDARARRQRRGAIELSAGLVAAGGGVALSLASPARLAMSGREHALTTSALVSLGLATASAGLFALVVRSPVEEAWDAVGQSAVTAPTLRVGVAPLDGGRGAFGVLAGAF